METIVVVAAAGLEPDEAPEPAPALEVGAAEDEGGTTPAPIRKVRLVLMLLIEGFD